MKIQRHKPGSLLNGPPPRELVAVAYSPTRRRWIVDAFGGLTALALGNACGPNGGTGGTGGAGGGAGAPNTSCTLYPQQVQGPYYLDLDLLRVDVTEGKPGAPLLLDVQVVRSGSCAPLGDVAVDIWQCDAAGVYSGYPGQLGGLDTTGQRFLRGTQLTDAAGHARFETIYPGWYPGRTTHIHFKVQLSPSSEVISQIYFPEDFNASVYGSAPYAERGQKETSNAADFIAQSGGGMPALLSVSGSPSEYRGTLIVGVAG
ncbi:MAG TPA: intradiol ring-cleavage dioxygenase [Polyangiaceae bacterium]